MAQGFLNPPLSNASRSLAPYATDLKGPNLLVDASWTIKVSMPA